MMRQVFEIKSANLDPRDEGATIIVFEELGSGFPRAAGVLLFLGQEQYEGNDWLMSWAPHGAVQLRDLDHGFDYAKQRMREMYGIELGREIT